MQTNPTDKYRPEKPTPMAMVLLDTAALPPTDQLFKAFKDFPPIPQVDESIQNITRKGDTVTFTLCGETGFVSLMPAPVPWSDLEGPCVTSLYWREAAAVLKPHAAHVIVSIMPRTDDLSMVLWAILLTKLTSSVALALGSHALGIYWPTGTLVQSVPFFLESAHKIAPDCLPLELWIEFRLQLLPAVACNVLTTGLDIFGLPEIEVINSKRKPQQVLPFVINLAEYLLQNGPVIKAGDTVGEDADQKITVEFTASTWDRPEKVMKVLY